MGERRTRSERFMFSAGILVSMGVPVEDVKHICDLLEAEEQGLLLRLPCKIGDKVYKLFGDVLELEVKNMSITEDGMRIDIEHSNGCLGFSLEEQWFRNHIYKTKEEAEQKLKELMNE